METKYLEQYNPDSGQIYTMGGGDLTEGQRLKKAFFMVSANANISYVTTGGQIVLLQPVLAGVQYDIEVSKITALSAGICYIRHNGESLIYAAETAPGTQALSITFANVAATTIDVDWTDGSGMKRILVARSGGAVNADPVNGTTYTGDLNFGDGDEIGTGNFVLAVRENFDGAAVTVTGLTTATTYHFQVFEYRGLPGQEKYNLADGSANNPRSQITA